MHKRIAVIGGKSLVGRYLLEMLTEDAECFAFTRKELPASKANLKWKALDDLLNANISGLDAAICISHIWVAPELVEHLAQAGAKKIVAISSTSKFTKVGSGTAKERALVAQLETSEALLICKARAHGIECVILRPTLIHGDRVDKNIAEIGRIIERFRLFPVFGKARGLRQPIHARDVAGACLLALNSSNTNEKSYNIPGGETLTYHEMVKRIFFQRGIYPIMPSIPIWVFKLVLSIIRRFPRFKNWTVDMALRMNEDLVFDIHDANKDFGFSPGIFKPD